MPVANDPNHTWLPSGDDYRLLFAINPFLGAHDASPSFSNDIFAAFISHPYFVHLPSWNIYSCSDAKCLLGWVLILRIRDGKRPSADEMSCHTIVGMWRVMRFSDPTCQILLFCYKNLFCSRHHLRSISPREDVSKAPAFDNVLILYSSIAHACNFVTSYLIVEQLCGCQRRNTPRKKRNCADIDLADAISVKLNSPIWRRQATTSAWVEWAWTYACLECL
jgi:hypothetical protein